jgi:hypothetical protein
MTSCVTVLLLDSQIFPTNKQCPLTEDSFDMSATETMQLNFSEKPVTTIPSQDAADDELAYQPFLGESSSCYRKNIRSEIR